jgi:hypothetical protein
MATTSNPGAEQPATTRKTTATRKNTAPRKTAATRKPADSTHSSTQPKTRVKQVQVLAERAVLVPMGASLLARDNVVSTVKGLASKYTTRSGLERELHRFERRGASARNRFERQVRRTSTKFERELRQRRSRVERTVLQKRRRFEREVRSVRKDLEKQSGTLSARATKLVSDAQERISSAS